MPDLTPLTSLPVDSVLRQAVNTGAVAGVVAMAATHEGVVYGGAFGRRDLSSASPMALDTVFRIASLTKAVTSVAAMQLVEQGKVTLDQPLGEFLPGLAAAQVLEGFSSSGEPLVRPARTAVTLHHLLTHTSGFSYNTFDPLILQFQKRTNTPDVDTGRRSALGVPLIFEPDTRWEYGISTDWLGQLVELISGKSLDVYFQDHIFAPLGLHEIGYALHPQRRSRLSRIHQRKQDGLLEPFDHEYPRDPEFVTGGHGLYSTPGDYLAFQQMILCGGSLRGARILRPESVALMSRNQIGQLDIGPLRTTLRTAWNDIEFFPGIEKKWGYGFLITVQALPTGRSAGSLSWAGIYNLYYWIDLRKRIAGLFMTQTLPFGDAKVLRAYGSYEKAIYQSLGAN